MYCQNCGEKVENGAVFCVKCGDKIERDPIVSNNSKSGNKKSAASSPKLSMKKLVKICGVAAIGIILILLLVNKKTVISLNEYVTVDFSGYDSYGKAEVHFDDKAFIKDYGNTVKYHGSENEVTAFYKPVEILKEKYITGELDSTERLSNGDTIEFIWDCDDEAAKKNYKSKLKYEDITFKVSGLTKVKKVDPFDKCELIYSGLSPQGSVLVRNKYSDDKLFKGMHFIAEPSDNLSNGSKITVRASHYWDTDIVKYYLENYGVALTQIEKEYTVDGLGRYVATLDEIPDEMLQEMKDQSKDAMDAYIASNWKKQQSLEGMTYLGNYLLIAKNQGAYTNNNRLFLLYKIQASINYEEENIHNNYTYYYFTVFDNIVIFPDGTYSVDLSNYQVSGATINCDIQYGSSWYDSDMFYFKGYEQLDTIFNKYVIANVERYTYESNVTDIEVDNVQVDEDAEAQQETDEETDTETDTEADTDE